MEGPELNLVNVPLGMVLSLDYKEKKTLFFKYFYTLFFFFGKRIIIQQRQFAKRLMFYTLILFALFSKFCQHLSLVGAGFFPGVPGSFSLGLVQN